MIRTIATIATLLLLTGCVSNENADVAWADKRCAEVAPNHDRAKCIAAYIEAREAAQDLSRETEDQMFHYRREDDAATRQRF